MNLSYSMLPLQLPANRPGKPQTMVQELGFLPPMWKIWMVLWLPYGQGLAVGGIWDMQQYMQDLCLAPLLCLSKKDLFKKLCKTHKT